MHAWLYGPQGYYKTTDVGKKGDFYTSVSTSMFFGGTLGKLVVERVRSGALSPRAHIVEVGAHQGHMMADMIQFIYSLEPTLIKSLRFTIIEPLESLRLVQEKNLKAAFGEAVHVSIFPSLEAFTCKEALVFANELFDAFACEVIMEDTMLHIENHVPVFVPIEPALREKARLLGVEKGEITCGLEAFALALRASCEKCECIAFDYGEVLPRNDISLRVYQNHQSTPFFELTCKAGPKEYLAEYFAKADLTYDVHFGHVQQAMEAAGFTHQETKTQASALVAFGLMELLEMLQQNVDEATYRAELEKAKQLILPAFLGERFKMIRFTK